MIPYRTHDLNSGGKNEKKMSIRSRAYILLAGENDNENIYGQ